MTTVLITGAAGFIGSNFLRYLYQHRESWNFVVLDKLTYAGNLENIQDLLGGDRVVFEKTDICEVEEVARIFGQYAPELVFHLAAESHVDRSIMSSRAFVETNVLGTAVLLDAARAQSSVRRFVHVSTDEVYGALGAEGRFTESTPLDPTSPYAASKAASDLLALSYAKTHKMNLVLTRCTNNYGPYQFPEKFIPLFITNAMQGKALPLYGRGENVRSWIHVDDHSEALLRVAEKGAAGEVYNIGGFESAELPNHKVAAMIMAQLGVPADLLQLVGDRPAHDFRYAVDITKMRSELRWEPTIEFEQGLSDTISWYQEHTGWWERIKSGAYLKFYEQNYGQR
jgi:dTDP-glucose 4,6-dehydratase